MKLEFKRGDVICKIGGNVKWVVIGGNHGFYVTGQNWNTYHVKRIMGNTLDQFLAWEVEFTERNYVKVGEWDFENNVGVDND